MNVDCLIHARWIIPVTPDDAVLENHTLVIHEGRIQALLPTAEAGIYKADQEHHLGQHALIPGLINAHTHTAMNLMRGIADDLPLMTWLHEHIWPVENRWMSEEFVVDGSRHAIAEMLRGGTTCFQDMYFYPENTARVAAAAGMRSCPGLIMIDFPSPYADGPDAYIHRALEVHDEFRDNPLVHTVFAPHAPYSCSDEPLSRIRMLSDELDRPVHIHVQETLDEIQQSQEKHGCRPIERLHRLGLVNPLMIGVHMVHLDDEEIALWAENGAHMVHCPESNMKLGNGFAPVKKLLDAGVNVALGTDGVASNNDLDMFSEMRTAALLAKGVSQDATAVPAMQALRMATINGAKALGLEELCGSLEIGKAADITAVRLNSLETQPLYELVSQLVYSTGREQVSDVWVAGRHLLKSRQLTTLDEADILSCSGQWQERLAAANSE